MASATLCKIVISRQFVVLCLSVIDSFALRWDLIGLSQSCKGDVGYSKLLGSKKVQMTDKSADIHKVHPSYEVVKHV